MKPLLNCMVRLFKYVCYVVFFNDIDLIGLHVAIYSPKNTLAYDYTFTEAMTQFTWSTKHHVRILCLHLGLISVQLLDQ